MNYLVVTAHPDDEVLGAGATIFNLSKRGHQVSICILSSQVNARALRPSIDKLSKSINEAAQLLGAERVIEGNFPNIEFNNVPHIELVRFIEDAIVNTSSSVVLTHHPADSNNDHLHTSMACQAAIRVFQRRSDVKVIDELFFMEIPSSTEWGVNESLRSFSPNTFIEIGEEAMQRKLDALSLYEGVIRPYPHPRSELFIRGLAAYRGGQAGLDHAEAFESVFRRIKI